MSDEKRDEESLRGRISAAGEDALGEVAQTLLENPLFNQALTTALGAGQRALEAQRSALGALNLPSARDIERLERRVRRLSERLEGLEDRLDAVGDELVALRRRLVQEPPSSPDQDRSAASGAED